MLMPSTSNLPFERMQVDCGIYWYGNLSFSGLKTLQQKQMVIGLLKLQAP